MENDLFNFLRPSNLEDQHPIDRSVNWWVNRTPAYKKILIDGTIIPVFIKVAKLCITDSSFLEAEAENFIDGWVIFAAGFSKGDERKMSLGESLIKPMLNKIIEYISSDSFKKYVLKLYVSGDEKLPINIPEILISVEALLLYSNKAKEIFFNADQVAKLKRGFVEDKMKEWGILGEFGEKLKFLEHFLHPEIFNPNGFLLFDYLMKSQDFKVRGAIEDVSYFFHQLKKENYVHCGRDIFRKWFNDHYSDFPYIEKIHNQRSRVPLARAERFLAAIDNFKSKKI